MPFANLLSLRVSRVRFPESAWICVIDGVKFCVIWIFPSQSISTADVPVNPGCSTSVVDSSALSWPTSSNSTSPAHRPGTVQPQLFPVLLATSLPNLELWQILVHYWWMEYCTFCPKASSGRRANATGHLRWLMVRTQQRDPKNLYFTKKDELVFDDQKLDLQWIYPTNSYWDHNFQSSGDLTRQKRFFPKPQG